MDVLERAEARRVAALAVLDPARQARAGQFFTPARAATLIASLPRLDELTEPVRVLDPGAGSGILSAALVARVARERPGLRLHVVAVESDPVASRFLAETLSDLERSEGITTELVSGDYLAGATGLAPDSRLIGPFDLVIMNPPYGKLGAADPSRRAVAAATVDPPNLYAAFWALGVDACRRGGQVVAIVPRSWANGTYFSAFRRWLLDRMTLDRLHVFGSRSAVFADTGVLQENVIVCGTVGGATGTVTLSESQGHLDDVTRREVAASAVVQPQDTCRFVRFTDGAASVSPSATSSLASLGLSVSTGRVVDFRAREWLTEDPHEPGSVPLIYPGNIRGGDVVWPRDLGKPQGFRVSSDAARRQLVSAGSYTLTKRFSAKEERRRIVAGVWNRAEPPAFENHLNYFHERGNGLPLDVAWGLSAWLNSTAVDALFRTFSGHTQVNAGDLRALPYPSREDLATLGRLMEGVLPDQVRLDALVDSVLSGPVAVAS